MEISTFVNCNGKLAVVQDEESVLNGVLVRIIKTQSLSAQVEDLATQRVQWVDVTKLQSR